MVYDEQVLDLLSSADIINAMVLDSEVYIKYKNAYSLMHASEEVKALEKTFIQLKHRYDEVMRFGRYHPDYMDVLLKTRRAKKVYEMHPLVADTKRFESECQSLLDEIITIIASSISTEIKVEHGNPFFTTDHQCGGGCSCSA